MVPKYLATKILFNYRGKKRSFTMEKAGRHHLNPKMKVNISSIGTNGKHVQPERM